MRKEDIQAIVRAIAIFKCECQEHELCRGCNMVKNHDCVLNKPPAHLDANEIIEALERR